MSASRDHHDNRGVFVELWVLDLVGNDYPAAILLSQLMWWAQPAKDGRPKLGYERDGQLWLVRPNDEWHDETRLTARQVEQAKRRLKSAGLIVTKRVHRGEQAVVTAIRPDFDTIREQADTGSEYTRSRSSQSVAFPNARDRDGSNARDRVVPFSSITTSEVRPSPPKDEQALSSSSRSSSNTDASADEQPAGLTPCPKPQVAAACPTSETEARRIADRCAAGKATTLVRIMTPALRDLLDKGVDPAKLERLAMGLTVVTAGTLGIALDREDERAAKAKLTGPDGFALKPRPGPPPPPVYVAKGPAISAEERAEGLAWARANRAKANTR